MKQPLLLTILFLNLFQCSSVNAQKILIFDSSQADVSFRGLSVVNDTVFWVSGSKGTVGKSTDGGLHTTWMHPVGFENRHFCDVEAFDSNTALVMAIDSPGIILKTTDGGATWRTVYESHVYGIFLDAMAFKDSLNGVCVGDPINVHFWLIETTDGGDTWKEVPPQYRPIADIGEFVFASSGTSIQYIDDPQYEYGFVSAGLRSKLHLINRVRNAPCAVVSLKIINDSITRGANSWAVNNNKFVVLGGDYTNYTLNDYNSTYSTNMGRSWLTPRYLPAGYKSCVVWKDSKNLIATGMAGTDISISGPKEWKHISDSQFHVVEKAKQGSAIYLAGQKGLIGIYYEGKKLPPQFRLPDVNKPKKKSLFQSIYAVIHPKKEKSFLVVENKKTEGMVVHPDLVP